MASSSRRLRYLPDKLGVVIPATEETRHLQKCESVEPTHRGKFDRIIIFNPSLTENVLFIQKFDYYCWITDRTLDDIFDFNPREHLRNENRKLAHNVLHTGVANDYFVFARIDNAVSNRRIRTILTFLNAHFDGCFSEADRREIYDVMVENYSESILAHYTYPPRDPFTNDFHFHYYERVKAVDVVIDLTTDSNEEPIADENPIPARSPAPVVESVNIDVQKLRQLIFDTVSKQLLPMIDDAMQVRERRFEELVGVIRDDIKLVKEDISFVKFDNLEILQDQKDAILRITEGIGKLQIHVEENNNIPLENKANDILNCFSKIDKSLGKIQSQLMDMRKP